MLRMMKEILRWYGWVYAGDLCMVDICVDNMHVCIYMYAFILPLNLFPPFFPVSIFGVVIVVVVVVCCRC